MYHRASQRIAGVIVRMLIAAIVVIVVVFLVLELLYKLYRYCNCVLVVS